jgi:hypothetical protein
MSKKMLIFIILLLIIGAISNHILWNEKFKNEEERVFLLQQQISSKDVFENNVPFKKETQELILEDIKTEYRSSLDSNYFLHIIYEELSYIRVVMEDHWKENLLVQKKENNKSTKIEESNSESIEKQLNPNESAIKEIQKSRDFLVSLNEREDLKIPSKYKALHTKSVETSEQALRYLNAEVKYLTEDFPYDNVITNKNMFMSNYNNVIFDLNVEYKEMILD